MLVDDCPGKQRLPVFWVIRHSICLLMPLLVRGAYVIGTPQARQLNLVRWLFAQFQNAVVASWQL